MRLLTELINLEEPAWPWVQQWLAKAKNSIEALPPADAESREAALLAVQVTTRSPLGAVAYETGGLLVDHGWLRILGSGHPRLPRSLPAWNQFPRASPLPFWLIADDVIGGFFAIDGGGLGFEPGKVAYFGPETLKWENLRFSYTDFLDWSCIGDLEDFYLGYRWPGWQEDLKLLAGDQAFFIYPPLWTQGPPIAERLRKPISIAELYNLTVGRE